MTTKKKPSLDERRQEVLSAARMAYRRLKRRRLMMDISLYPDRSPEVVAILAAFAYDVHAYLKRTDPR